MYEDHELFPFKCSRCLNEFEEQIGRVKTEGAFRCPECGLLHYGREEFLLYLSEARKGTLDPYGEMLRIRKRD
jgi:hypothetical protein